MIAYLDGKLVQKQPTRIILDVNGIGYDIGIPLSSYDRLPSIGEQCRLLIYYHIREDAHQMFGFMTDGEKEMFKLLMSVTGIGPRLAMSALSGLTVGAIKSSIANGDTGRLSSISGIGRKVAERIVVELKDRMTAGDAMGAADGSRADGECDGMVRDAMLALVSLGYRQDAARKMVMGAIGNNTGNMNVEELVRKSLSSGGS